ncbi:major surface protein 3 [Anaplasma centrale str. Israel]|uniref:Major surface protein 3 n=2 Tax=Anaplasma centrale TaxID=769 RepID=D1AUH6_ANACI|nr:major surface protein 3 [Anaplasma centrale str. Israel]
MSSYVVNGHCHTDWGAGEGTGRGTESFGRKSTGTKPRVVGAEIQKGDCRGTNICMNGITGVKFEEAGLFPLLDKEGEYDSFSSHHFNFTTPLKDLEFGNSTCTFGGSMGYRLGGARVEVEVGYERFVIKGGDNTAFLLGRDLTLDTVRGQLLSSALGRMSMGDVKRFRKEVVDSIGAGTASPVRAVFSSAVLGSAVPSADGDTFLMGEMVGVDEGLVIQELSRADELVKLQHELEKQVSKLAELGELKWLEELEKLQDEEIQKVKDSIGEMETKLQTEVEAARKAVVTTLGEDINKLLGQAKVEALKKWDTVMITLGPMAKEQKLKEWEKALEKLEEIKKWDKVKQERDELKEKLKEIEKIKVKELQKVKEKIQEVEIEKLEKVVKEWEKIGAKEEKAKEEWEKAAVKLKKLVQGVKDLKSKLEELETIKGVGERLKDDIEKIKEPGDLEQLEARKIEEVKTAKGEAKKVLEKESLGDLDKLKDEKVKEKLQAVKDKVERNLEGLTAEKVKEVITKIAEVEKVKKDVTSLGLKGIKAVVKLKDLKSKLEELAAIRKLKELGLEERLRELAGVKEVKRLAERQKAGELDVQGGLQLTEKIKALSVDMVGRLEARRLGENTDGGLAEKLGILGRLDELVPGDRAKKLEEMKVTLKQLRELAEKEKLALVTKQGVVNQGIKTWGLFVGLVEKAFTGKEALGDILKGKELVKLEKTLSKIKALEELTEIAEKRGVATVMKAALTSAMEITKNRGWTDYLNKVDSGKKSDAVKELIAAEKIRKLTQYINTLEADEKAVVAGAFAKAVEGAEVIEVRAIGSTSVMLNACYDLLTDGIGVVPYACAGIGGNFISVVDGHINPKFAYRVKAGLSYALTPEISAFAGAFYHKVLGDGDYDELPLSPIADYTGPAGRNKETGVASFTMAYFGGEFGVRFAF